MGKRGPQKKPTELKLLQGCPGGKHKLNENEPRPEPAKGAEPAHALTPEAREIWDREVPRLEALGLLSVIDVAAFTRYCDIRANWARAKSFLDKNGLSFPVYFPPTDAEVAARAAPRLKKHEIYPEVRVYLETGRELSRLEASFGMNPAARAGLNVIPPEQQPGQTIEDFLYGTGE